jgi:hypothetical protein
MQRNCEQNKQSILSYCPRYGKQVGTVNYLHAVEKSKALK